MIDAAELLADLQASQREAEELLERIAQEDAAQCLWCGHSVTLHDTVGGCAVLQCDCPVAL